LPFEGAEPHPYEDEEFCEHPAKTFRYFADTCLYFKHGFDLGLESPSYKNPLTPEKRRIVRMELKMLIAAAHKALAALEDE
jgi:hypothetical protein